jgi:hypothetical protein
MAVFKIDRNFEVILNPEAVKLIPEISGLSNKELLYVIYTVDYVDSPLRKKPFDERRLIARRMVFGKEHKSNVETKAVQIGMKAYKSLVFDIRRETIDIYNKKVQILQKETLNPDLAFSRMKEIDLQINFMQDKIAALNHSLDIEEGDNVDLKGGKKLSQVEIWQRNQMTFKEYLDNQ